MKLPKTRGMLRREAARWLVRLQSGRDPDSERRFRRWHDADPAHAAAFERVQQSYDRAGMLQSAAAARPDGVHEPSAQSSSFEWAAAAALIMLLGGAVLLTRSPLVSGTNAVMLVTRIGEIKRVDLDDGSKVTLDGGTSVEVDIGRGHRRARLKRGRARFEVAQNADPFVVDAGRVIVITLVSVFDVENAGQQSRVRLYSGSAKVRTDDASAFELRRGEDVTASAVGVDRKQFTPGQPAWTGAMLEFDSTPLSTAIGLANGYSRNQIRLSGDIGQLRVSGAFHAGEVAGLCKALSEALGLSLGQTPSGDWVLSPKPVRGRPEAISSE